MIKIAWRRCVNRRKGRGLVDSNIALNSTIIYACSSLCCEAAWASERRSIAATRDSNITQWDIRDEPKRRLHEKTKFPKNKNPRDILHASWAVQTVTGRSSPWRKNIFRPWHKHPKSKRWKGQMSRVNHPWSPIAFPHSANDWKEIVLDHDATLLARGFFLRGLGSIKSLT